LGEEARRVEVAFVTVDRERDTPAQLAPYLDAFVAGGHALRPASDAQLASAEQAFGASSSISRTPGGDVEVSHTGTMYVVDASGRIAVEWPFGSTPKAMARDLGALLAGRAASAPTSSAR
jgi:protein SCO1/2